VRRTPGKACGDALVLGQGAAAHVGALAVTPVVAALVVARAVALGCPSKYLRRPLVVAVLVVAALGVALVVALRVPLLSPCFRMAKHMGVVQNHDEEHARASTTLSG